MTLQNTTRRTDEHRQPYEERAGGPLGREVAHHLHEEQDQVEPKTVYTVKSNHTAVRGREPSEERRHEQERHEGGGFIIQGRCCTPPSIAISSRTGRRISSRRGDRKNRGMPSLPGRLRPVLHRSPTGARLEATPYEGHPAVTDSPTKEKIC